MLLKIKNDEVRIKGRGFTYGRKQWNWLSKDDTPSTDVSNEDLIISCMIDAIKVRYLATAEIPGDF